MIEPGERRLLIDGALVDASGGATFENVNPFTEQSMGVVADGTPDEVLRARGAELAGGDHDPGRGALQSAEWGGAQLRQAVAGRRLRPDGVDILLPDVSRTRGPDEAVQLRMA